ncbi:MAG: sugar ABC transporter substrate-binding protein, partial [Trebonia sp.]
PTVAAQCIKQAVADKSAGIITDSLPYAMAENAYAAAVAARMPIVVSDVLDPMPAGWSKDLVATDNGQGVGSALMADAIIADSDGKANVLFADTTTNSTTKDAADAVLSEFATYCPGCKVTTVNWSPAQVQQIPTAVSVALNTDRSIDYVFASYDQPAGPAVVQGMQLSGRQGKLKLVGYGAVVAAMEQIADGTRLADVAVDPAIVAWNNTDRLLRLMTGEPVPAASAYDVPRRVFDKSNIGSVDGKSVAAYESGSWFSNGSFRTTYAKLWGAS